MAYKFHAYRINHDGPKPVRLKASGKLVTPKPKSKPKPKKKKTRAQMDAQDTKRVTRMSKEMAEGIDQDFKFQRQRAHQRVSTLIRYLKKHEKATRPAIIKAMADAEERVLKAAYKRNDLYVVDRVTRLE